MSSTNLLLETSHKSLFLEQSQSHMPKFPGPLDKSSAYLRASSAPSSVLIQSYNSRRRRSSATSSKSNYSNSNSSLPTTILMMSSNSSIGGASLPSSTTPKRGRGDSRTVWSAQESQNYSRPASSREDTRTNRKVNLAIARTIASNSQLYTTQLVDNPHVFKTFQDRLIQSGTITNLAAREVLRNDIMKSKDCYVRHKRELVSQHEAEANAAAQGAAGGAVKGMKRVLSSAFSLDTLAGLESEACSTSNFGNIDLAEQHAIMSEIMASRNGKQQATQAQPSLAASRKRSSATTISGGAGSGAYHDSYAGDFYSSQASDLSAAVPTAAQLLANSLGNQVKRISMSLSSVAKPSPYDGSSSNGVRYDRSSSVPSMITSSTAPSSAYTGQSSYQRCSSLTHASRRSSVESIGSTNTAGVPPTGTVYEMNLNDLKHNDTTETEDNLSASTLNADQTPQRRGSRRLSNLRMSFLAFDDVFDEDLDEVSDEDRSTSSSGDHDDSNYTTKGSADTSSKSFAQAQHEMDTIVLQDQVLAAKLQSAENLELLCAWPHQMRAARRRASMASDASSISEYEQDVKKSADEELYAQTTEMRRQFYRRMSDHRLNRMGSDRKLSSNGKKKDGDGRDCQDFNESVSTIKKARAA